MDKHPIKAEKDDGFRSQSLSNSVFNGKIMLASVVILLLACIIVVCFHIYARNRQNHLRNQRERGRRRDYFASSDTISQGLDPSILNTLSTFTFSRKSPPLECAVCLSEFEDDKIGRVLPNCNHCFHLQCIDMWFQFHSNCPLCRAPVQPVTNLNEVAGLESGLVSSVSQRLEEQMVCSTSVCVVTKGPMVSQS